MTREHVVQIDANACVGCGLCRRDCPTSNLLMENKKAKVIAQDCIMCGHCVAVCPKAAVSISGFDEPAEQIAEQALLDPQTLLAALKMRRSIRQFTQQQIAPELITQVLEAGRLTPTGGNEYRPTRLTARLPQLTWR